MVVRVGGELKGIKCCLDSLYVYYSRIPLLSPHLHVSSPTHSYHFMSLHEPSRSEHAGHDSRQWLPIRSQGDDGSDAERLRRRAARATVSDQLHAAVLADPESALAPKGEEPGKICHQCNISKAGSIGE